MSTLQAPTISKKDLKFINKNRINYIQKAIRIRLTILWLTTVLNNAVDIAKFAGCSTRHVFNTIEIYKRDGLQGVLEYDKKNRTSELEPYADLIKQDLIDHPLSSGKEIRQRIIDLTGIKKSINQCLNFIKSLGAKCLKPTKVPMGKHETDLKKKVEKQKAYVKNTLSRHIRAHRAGKCLLLLMDACHVQLACMVGFIWCFAKPYIPMLNVRGRVNVIGAVSAHGKHFAYDISQSSVNKEAIIRFLDKLRSKYKDQKIRLVLDNASYHRAAVAQEHAKKLGITLVFLPVASPNLNIIERLWNFMKYKFLRNKILTHLDELENTLVKAFKTLKKQYKKDLKSLLTTKFQHFDDTMQFVIV